MLNRKDPFAKRDAAAAAQAANPAVPTRNALQPVVSSNGVIDGYRNAKVPITPAAPEPAAALARKDPAMPLDQRNKILERVANGANGPAAPMPDFMDPQAPAAPSPLIGVTRKPRPRAPLTSAMSPALNTGYTGPGSPGYTQPLLESTDGN